MRKTVILILTIVITLISLMYVTVEGSSKEVAKINDAVEVLDDIMAILEKGMPPARLKTEFMLLFN